MTYTMTADENGKVTAVRNAITTAKQLIQDAEAQMSAAVSNIDALMAIQKTAGRADSYTSAYVAKGGFVRLGNELGAIRGLLIEKHGAMSLDLQRLFTDGPAFALSAPGR